MKHIWLALTAAFGLAGTATAEVDDTQVAARIFENLYTPRDVPVAFIERRSNPLLEEPLKLVGSVIFSANGELSKIIVEPMRESVVISPDFIRLERDGHARELPIGKQKGAREFYLGLRALLDGDLETVTQIFIIDASRDDGADWQIDLTPRKKHMKKFVERMVVSGTGSTVMRIRTTQSADAWQEMIFAPVARE